MTIPQSSRRAKNDWPNAVLYRLTSPSGAVYIGQTRNLKARLANYRSIARGKGGDGGRHQRLLARSLMKHGMEAHQLDVLHTMPVDIAQEALDSHEIYAIQMHKNMASITRILNCSRGGGGTRPHTTVRPLSRPELQGEGHPLAKLSTSDVVAIKESYRWGSSEFGQSALAKRYRVSPRLIHSIIKGKAWAHIKVACLEADKTASRLSVLDASKIRERYASGQCTHRSLAAEYHTNHQTIGQIIRNPDWGKLHAAPIFEARLR